MAEDKPQVTVWYDGACPLCLREIALMRRLDRHRAIAFVDASDPGAPVSCPIDRAGLLARFHVREGEDMHSGAAAFAAMWRAIPLLKPFGHFARLPGMLPLLDRFYTMFLRVRPRLIRLLFGGST